MKASKDVNGEISGNVLIVDDDINIRDELRGMLGKDGYEIRDAGSGGEALQVVQSFACEAAIIDIHMPDMQGTELLHELKSLRPYLAVILLTEHSMLPTAITAIEEGAFNYLLKPVKPEKLRQAVSEGIAVTRLQYQETQFISSRRDHFQQPETLPNGADMASEMPRTRTTTMYQIGDLLIDDRAHKVQCAGEEVVLTPSEYDVLLILAQRAGEVVDYVTLVKLGLKFDAPAWEAKDLIKRHIYTLRQKLEPEPNEPHYIHNVRAIGYRLDVN